MQTKNDLTITTAEQIPGNTETISREDHTTDSGKHSAPYHLEQAEKDLRLTEQLKTLTEYHREHCPEYAHMLSAIGFDFQNIRHYHDLPFLPAGMFKRLRLSSLPEEADFKTTTSSGTSSQQTSQIILDGETRTLQQQALAQIGMDFLGEQRLPMLVIDCPATVKKRDHFSARTSGILGFSVFGRHRTFALTDDMKLNTAAVREFLDTYGNAPFLIFGFTWMIWEYLICEINRSYTGKTLPSDAADATDLWQPDLSHGILVHGGGWKKLEGLNISKEQFRSALKETCGLTRVHDYYGMAEQTGSIFMECEYGHLHASDYSGILFRRAEDFSVCEIGEPGIAQVLSVLPKSYPGHSILTEDEGVLLGVDDCPCGRCGAYFQIFGRLKHAEIRGCSDTYEA